MYFKQMTDRLEIQNTIVDHIFAIIVSNGATNEM